LQYASKKLLSKKAKMVITTILAFFFL